ncbi:hypothetical protein [Deinococcus pimensis]|uniref:hypothetical protein n=1 Tax=Deinococcus pimensis TaxID=309888 RepID=UPI0012FCCA3B|nr:hypothetical protein [Deinococcus pimensis]
MQTTTLLGAFLISASLLTVCGGDPPTATPSALPGGSVSQPVPQPGTRTISGTVTPTAGADVQGIIVCPVRNDDCDWDNTDGIVIKQAGRQATFTTGTFADGEYVVIAWKDNASNGEFGAEDNLSIDSSDEKTLGRVRPSTINVIVTMLAFDQPGAATRPADPLDRPHRARGQEEHDGHQRRRILQLRHEPAGHDHDLHLRRKGDVHQHPLGGRRPGSGLPDGRHALLR